jgi:tetratricopeptide (TPR) repeat protein
MAAATIDSDGVVPIASVTDAVGDVDDHAAATRVQEDDAERALREVIEAAQSDADVAEIAVSDTASFEEQHAVNEPAALLDSPLERETLVSAEAPVHAAMLTPAAVNAASLTPTPTLPIAAVAAEANVVATSRRDELRAATLRAPQDWVLRRRLAEALFEAGEREAGLSELHATLSGYSQRGQLADASDIADELVRISPERIQYHQKRVELAVRLSDQQRLRRAYLDLADTLVRSGDDAPCTRCVRARPRD